MLAPECNKKKKKKGKNSQSHIFLSLLKPLNAAPWRLGKRTFDVPVDDHVAVQVGHPLQDLPGVAPRHIFRQGTVRLQLVLDGTLQGSKVVITTSHLLSVNLLVAVYVLLRPGKQD